MGLVSDMSKRILGKAQNLLILRGHVYLSRVIKRLFISKSLKLLEKVCFLRNKQMKVIEPNINVIFILMLII